MKLIVITQPYFFEEEANAIHSLFDAGLDILHLRKPDASPHEVMELLDQLPVEYRGKIVLHEHFSLATSFGLKGIHLNRRNPHAPVGYKGHISRSCHSLEELIIYKEISDYLFLSPIFDSISKEGYSSGYSAETLRQASNAGIIDSRVIALGGISLKRLSEVKEFSFGGAALLGDIWQRPFSDIRPHFLACKHVLTSDSIYP